MRNTFELGCGSGGRKTKCMRYVSALLPLLPGVCMAQTPCRSTPVYEPCDIEFELTEAEAARHSNPYATVEFRAEFRAPKGNTYRLPGFWDGGRKFKIRFSPLAEGKWDFRVSSNIERFNAKIGSFAATAPRTAGFIVPFNVHHFKYGEGNTPHLWMGGTSHRLASMPVEEFRSLIDGLAKLKFNHLRGLVLGDEATAAKAVPDPDHIVAEHFQAVDERVRYMNQKGITFDLILAGPNDQLEKLFPNWKQREHFIRYLVARYAAMNVTWQGVQEFETYRNAGALLKEIGALLKQLDPYRHPRSTGAQQTSGPQAGDGWMDYVTCQSPNPSILAAEYQLYPVPFVNVGPGTQPASVDEFRRWMWNAAVSGQAVNLPETGLTSQEVQQAGHLESFLAKTRYWDLEPYFRVEGGRALALEEVEYIVYMEKPGPVDLIVHKAGYEVSWFNPATGEYVDEKDFKGERYTADGPPDKSHDWVLYVRREGKKQGMMRSYKLESRTPEMQTVETNKSEVPFEIQLPQETELEAGQPLEFNATLKKTNRATRNMTWLWTGEVSASGLGYRVLGTSQFGQFTIPPSVARDYPATLHVRLVGLDGNGKIYATDRVYTLKK